MPHPCQTYPWFHLAGSLSATLDDQRAAFGGGPGWALYYDSPLPYHNLVLLEDALTKALAFPASPFDLLPQADPVFPSDDVANLSLLITNGLDLDKNNQPANPPPPPPLVSPHIPLDGWLLTPQIDPNWPAIDRARGLLQRVRGALDL